MASLRETRTGAGWKHSRTTTKRRSTARAAIGTKYEARRVSPHLVSVKPPLDTASRQPESAYCNGGPCWFGLEHVAANRSRRVSATACLFSTRRRVPLHKDRLAGWQHIRARDESSKRRNKSEALDANSSRAPTD